MMASGGSGRKNLLVYKGTSINDLGGGAVRKKVEAPLGDTQLILGMADFSRGFFLQSVGR